MDSLRETVIEGLKKEFHHSTVKQVVDDLRADFILQSDLHEILEKFTSGSCDCCISTAQIVLDYTWEKLNTGHWKDVDDRWRRLYYLISYIKAACQYMGCQELGAVIKTCDMGILLGVKPDYWNLQLTDLAHKLHSTVNDELDSENTSTDNYGNYDDGSTEQPVIKKPKLIACKTAFESSPEHVDRIHCPSLETFQRDYLLTGRPVVISGFMDHWPALAKWSTAYLKKIAGLRTVPVELGSRYTDSEWSQHLMTIAEFINRFMDEDEQSTVKGYLAQHQLFDQIPELKEDIMIPEFCALGENPEPDVNAWFGPCGTVSPMHQDPKSNLLCQVVGRKYIKICDSKFTNCLYPHEGMLSNTSQINAEDIDFNEFPLSKKAEFSELVLEPGDMLFLPAKYWHYVRSLSVSFSVSFWWE